MTTELNGPGPIAGEYKGGSSDNLNEQSDNSTPGGSNNGNSGNHDPNTAPLSAADKQIAAVKSDPKVRQRLADLIKGAKAINPNAHLFTSELSQSGMLTIGIDGLTVDQTFALGLRGIITITGTDGPHSFGSFDTGHKIGDFDSRPSGNNGSAENLAENKTSLEAYASVMQGEIPTGFWVDNEKIMTEVIVIFEINGGGKGNDRTGSRKEKVEVKSLTEAFKTWKRIKDEIADEARKAEEAHKAEEARKALFDKVGIQDTPVYTPEMVKYANAQLAAAVATVLNRAPSGIQLSGVGKGVVTALSEWAGSIAGALWRGAVAVAEIATASTAGPMVAAASTIFFSPPAGGGNDSKVPGRDIDMMAAQARLFTAGKVNIEPGMNMVDLPVRGFITTEDNGRQSVMLVKTGFGSVSATVPVLNGVRDKTTGLDKITVPAVAGAPSRTILVNPVPVGPAAPPHTGNSTPAPVTPVHTGTEVKQADSIVTTTFPAADLPPLQDFIYWQPDVTGTGVEPIYVMLNGPYGETNAKGKYSNRPYNTEKAGGPVQNLDWKAAIIDRAGIDKVKLHTGRFAESDANKVMIDRLEKILKGELQATDTDKRYYTHEVRELERYRQLGVKDSALPANEAEVWNNTHTATLEDYKLGNSETLLYTPEALKAAEEQELRGLK
ncbi:MULTISPECIES: S-type pyocin domain-containing protein [Klebsiella]|nr:S-type pyocin domain-containing protein [Klebsiella michiganensis]KFC36641.1 klebicin D activity protein [Klebsiella michiganensis]MCW9621790.1 S-type pyocin domain-containing protein [Klebsiella michiganensis]MDD9631998.1 S-type pyocin domain-containing protein [Klebsiella michiganensis]MDD9637391.1 S-type pyocin domain-containing protein [Klebsiella michiganensis]MDD9648419.1 S-type pyocin domain-containing protein [Klebsiella michiganensis]